MSASKAAHSDSLIVGCACGDCVEVGSREKSAGEREGGEGIPICVACKSIDDCTSSIAILSLSGAVSACPVEAGTNPLIGPDGGG